MKISLKWFHSVVALLLMMPVGAVAQERYMIGYAGFAGFQASMWAVKDLGLLAKYGLDGEVVMLPGSIRQIQAASTLAMWTRPVRSERSRGARISCW